MSTKAQVKTQAKTPAAPATARIPQPHVVEPEHEAERPDITAQLEGAARLGHSLGAVGVDSPAPPIIQRQGIPEEEEEELQLKREPAALQRQELPEEEEEELMMKPEEGWVGPQGGPVPPDVEAAIHRARGGGQPLDGALQEQMSVSLGHDFSRVRVHTDSEAHELNQQLQAKAFATGADIFFKRGAYDPASCGGQELIAHELSHVVQQSTGVVSGGGTGMTVRPAGDVFEQEADAMSKQIVLDGAAGLDKGRRRRGARTAPAPQVQHEGLPPHAMHRPVSRPALVSPVDIVALQRTVGDPEPEAREGSQHPTGGRAVASWPGVPGSASAGKPGRVPVPTPTSLGGARQGNVLQRVMLAFSERQPPVKGHKLASGDLAAPARGGFTWAVDWLPQRSKFIESRRGYIVQEVVENGDARGLGAHQSIREHYWERWAVNLFGKVTPRGRLGHDTFARPAQPKTLTEGDVRLKGTAYWVAFNHMRGVWEKSKPTDPAGGLEWLHSDPGITREGRSNEIVREVTTSWHGADEQDFKLSTAVS